MPIVQLPDGNSVDIPDNAPPEVLAQVKEKMRAQYAGQESGGVWNAVKSGAADLGRGASRALVTMTEGTPLGMSQKMTKLFQERMFGQAPDTPAELGNKAIDRVLPTPQGDSPGRQLVRAGLQGLGGAAATGPLGAVNYAAGLGSGLGGEMAKQAGLGPIGEFAGSLLGGVGGGTAAGLTTRLRPQSAAVAREALEGFTPKQFEDAQAYMNKVAAEGSNIDLAQALYATTGQQGNLTSIRNAIAGRSRGDSVQKVLREQPTQLAREAELTNLGMPGTNWSASQNANNLQEAATLGIEGAKKARSSAVKGLYAKAGDLAPESRQELGSILTNFKNQPGATEAMKSKADEMLRKLSGADDALVGKVDSARARLDAAKTPAARAEARAAFAEANRELQSATGAPLKALDVDTWIGELRGPWKGMPLKVADPKGAGQIKGLAGTLNNRFQELSPEVRAAEAEFARLTKETVNPLKQGPVGTIAQRAGYSDETGAQITAFEGLLRKGTDRNAKISDLKVATRELGKVDPNAIDDALKGHVSRLMQAAEESNPLPGGGPTNTNLAEKMYKSLFENPMQEQGLKDVMSESAKLKGADPDAVIRGLEGVKKLAYAMKDRPPATGGISKLDLERLGGSSNTANAVRVMSFLPANRAGEMIERAVLGKTFSQFDAILTSPEGVKMLMKLGNTPVMSKKFLTILGSFGGAAGNPDGLSDNNPPE